MCLYVCMLVCMKSLSVVECSSNEEVIVKEPSVDGTSRTFAFDRVFGPNSRQIEVYMSVVHPVIKEVLAGYNCTVFAYGQTGTGKTFTMEGERSNNESFTWSNDPLSGIIPRTLSNLFDEVGIQQVEHTVRVIFFEVYSEEIIDLLSSLNDKTKIRLDEKSTNKDAVVVRCLKTETVCSANEAYAILQRGCLKRHKASTLLNKESSKSHAIFSIVVDMKEELLEGEERQKTGQLNLVDLAGSENIGQSGAMDKKAREAGSINQSLLTIGRVITALVERKSHIPYSELSNLCSAEENNTRSFSHMRRSSLVTGKYPEALIEDPGNDLPPRDQIYCVLEYSFAGQELKDYPLACATQSLSIFTQTAFALAVGEAALQFEHRDLHLGSILVQNSDEDDLEFCINGEDYCVPTNGIEEEWELIFTYLLSYPNVLHMAVKDVEQGKVAPNLVCSFVMALCSCFSIYYRRIRILTEPRNQLLPVMFARLYLLQGIQQVLHNALNLLGITPVLHM
ncbi:kinesin-like protein KLP2 isoform X2 [Periplaneta americana]|uniref:kinesin-like protein KLP2 isoform X2 n=1 Tax=Periplaneta americana TaxID=6978 RepID=UPI0037E76833